MAPGGCPQGLPGGVQDPALNDAADPKALRVILSRTWTRSLGQTRQTVQVRTSYIPPCICHLEMLVWPLAAHLHPPAVGICLAGPHLAFVATVWCCL